MRPLTVASALAAVFLSLFMASGARLVDQDLRRDTRGTASAVQQRADAARRSSNAVEQTSWSPARPGAVVAHIFVAPRAALPRPSRALFMPGQLEPGAHALGTSLPRRLRWKALGGHGRNGPGLLI